jgi:hypothetical protein
MDMEINWLLTGDLSVDVDCRCLQRIILSSVRGFTIVVRPQRLIELAFQLRREFVVSLLRKYGAQPPRPQRFLPRLGGSGVGRMRIIYLKDTAGNIVRTFHILTGKIWNSKIRVTRMEFLLN